MPDISRRAAMGAGAGLLVGAMTVPASAQQIAAATTPKFRVQPLSFNPEKISSLSAKAIASHHGEHYAAAVNRLNALSEQLAKLDFAKAPAATMGELKREEHSVYNSTILHELCRHRQGAGRRLGLGDPDLCAARQAAIQSLVRGRQHGAGRWRAAARARHGQARLCGGLRRRGRQICGQLHADDPLDDARATLSRGYQGVIAGGARLQSRVFVEARKIAPLEWRAPS